MLLKRVFAGVLCAVILAGAVFYGVTFRFFDRALSAKAQEEFKQSIALPDNFTLAASTDSSEAAKNSLQAAREAANSGAYALELNIAFDDRSVPYLADGAEYITSQSVQLETVLKTNAKHSYMRYLFNLKSIPASASKLQELIKTYELTDRVILCGFTTESVRENRSQFSSFKLCIDVDGTAVNLKNAAACRKLLFSCMNAGAAYIRCTADEVTPELNKVLQAGTVRLIIDKVHTDYEMYYALSLNPKVVITDRPSELYTLLYSNEYLRAEMENPF